MIEKLIDRIGYFYPLKEKSVGEFKSFKVGHVNNECEAYDARNMGHIFTMFSKAYLGLRKSESLVIAPYDIDGPLFILDVINGKELRLDLIDVSLDRSYSEKRTLAVKEKYQAYLDNDQKALWYDNIRLSSSLVARFPDPLTCEECVMEMFEAYLKSLDEAHVSYSPDKKKKIGEYVESLLENGDTSIDTFLKDLGKEKTERFLNEAMFERQ